MTHIPLPFDGKRTKWENGHGTGGTYPLDTSGRRGAPLAWACRTPEHAATLARIFAGDLDASPARRHFTVGPDPADVPAPVRMCAACFVRPVRGGTRCEACARRDQRAARARPSLAVLWDGDDEPPQVAPEVARRVALRERRKALAAWMAGEGSTPPSLAARLGEVGA